jgi:hypothetical protein
MINPVANSRAVNFPIDNTGFTEYFQVLRNGGLGKWQVINNFPANTGISAHQQTDNPHPSRMPQGSRQTRELLSPVQFRHR